MHLIIEESSREQNELPTKKFKQYEKLIQNLKTSINYRTLRKIFMKEFLAPNDFKKKKL